MKGSDMVTNEGTIRCHTPCPPVHRCQPFAWLQRGAGTAALLQGWPSGSAGREETEAETRPWGAKGSFNQRGDAALLSLCFYRLRHLVGSSAAAVISDPRFLWLTQPGTPALLILSTA